MAEQALPPGALLPLPQAGGQLVRPVGGPLVGLPQLGGGLLQRLCLLRYLGPQNGLLLRGELLLCGEPLIVSLIPDLQRFLEAQDVLAVSQQIFFFHRHLLSNPAEHRKVYHNSGRRATRISKRGAGEARKGGIAFRRTA